MTPTRFLASYDARRGRFAMQHAAYVGGETWRNPPPSTLSEAKLEWVSTSTTQDTAGKDVVTSTLKSARRNTYLVPFPAESDRSFDLRIATASYINAAEIIVDSYAEGATKDVQRQLGTLAEYADDVDLRGSSWREYIEDVARWNAVYGLAFVVVDAPKADESIITRADEKAAGVRPYCVTVHPPAVAWIYCDAFGRLLEFAYVDEPFQSDTNTVGVSQSVTVRVYHSGRTDDAGNPVPAGWEVRTGTVSSARSLSDQRDALSDVKDSGELPASLGGRIPVVVSYFRRDTATRYPMGISLIDNACDITRTIYNRRSYELQIQREAGFPTLAIPVDGTGGKLPAQTRLAMGPTKGIGYSSASGAPQWIQPSAEWARDMRESNVADFQAALRTAGLEMATEAGASASGEALRIRSRDFEARCSRFARNLQRTEMAVLELLALYAGVTFDAKVTYPRRFVLPDLTADLQRALTLLNPSQMPVEIGPTAKLAAATQAVNAALVLSDEDQQKVREEIERILAEDEAEVEAQRKASAAQRDALVANLAKPKAANDVGTEPDKNSEGEDEDEDDAPDDAA
jgi:hypothetical protein